MTPRRQGRLSRALTTAASLALVATGAASVAAPAAAAAAANPHLSIGPVRIGTRQAPLVLPVNARRDADLTLRVNGHPVQDPFTFGGRRLQIANLSASDGLVPGVNRLRVRDTSSSASRRVRVPRSALLADAGLDAGTTVASVSRVGAQPDGPTALPGLRRRWRIVTKPPGAKVTLEHRHRAQPLLSAETPGTYVLRLRTRLKGSHRTSYDTVTDPVSPDTPPIGLSFDSLVLNAGGIVIDGQSYGADPAKDMHYAILERTTATVVKSGAVSSDAGGIDTLSNLARDYGTGDNKQAYMMVLNGLRGLRGVSADQQAAFSSLAKQLGATLFTPEQFAWLKAGQQFSIVGIPGAPAGAATVRIPDRDFGDPGNLTGYLEKDAAAQIHGTDVYDYVSPDRPAYDTGAQQSDSNTMTVGNKSYGVSLSDSGIAGATAGFHVVILDSQTLAPLENSILVTNSTDAGKDREMQGAVAGFLQNKFANNGDPTVLLETIGKPKAAGPEWQGIVNALGRLGANRQLVNALDGTTQYAIVGRVDSDQPPAEASTAYDPASGPAPPPARLVGALVQTRQSTFEPLTTNIPTAKNPEGGMNGALMSLAYQPPRDWPPLAGPGHADIPPNEASAAADWICKQISYCQGTDSCPDIRSCYWQDPDPTTSWATKSNTIGNLRYQGGHGFGSRAFDAVQEELGAETKMVGTVEDYFVRLQYPLTTAESRALFNLKTINQTVWNSVQKPTGESNAWGLDFASNIAGLFSLVEGPVGQAGASLAAGLTFGSYAADVHGQPILGDEINAKADALGQELLDRVDLAREEMGVLDRLIVSDYGKLSDAATDMAKKSWQLPDRFSTAAANDLTKASSRWFYEELVPVAYPYLIRGNAANARSLDCKIRDARGFPNQPDDAQMQATVGYETNGQPIKNVFFFTRGILGASSPPAGLAAPIFGSDGLGVQKLSFLTPRVFNGSIARADNGRYYCGLRWLPHWP